jgi:transcriptional regulator with PAS, ATPase and Fis domain
MIGRSDLMLRLFEKIRAAAKVTGAVLITGETGTGKELVAKAVHGDTNRGKFVAVDCGALPEDLIESELFGYRRGAFTTAVTDKPGLFEEANGGTLFLDEIANTSRRFQAKLLRVLQERQVRRLGDIVSRKLDIRVIAATNCELTTLVRKGDFREDLYYRLNVFQIHVPPLRKRIEDLPLLVEYILQGRKTISRDALTKLQAYSFPGNVRELENIVESAMYVVLGRAIEEEDIVLPSDVHRTETVADLVVCNFWESVARPFADRVITRNHVEQTIRKGLEQTRGSYRKLVPLFKMPDSDYKRFMDFLRRHHCNVDFRQYRKREEESRE